MVDVLFAAPFAMDNTMRFLRIVAELPGVRLGVLSQEPIERFPDDVRGRLKAYAQVSNALDTEAIATAMPMLATWVRAQRSSGVVVYLKHPPPGEPAARLGTVRHSGLSLAPW